MGKGKRVKSRYINNLDTRTVPRIFVIVGALELVVGERARYEFLFLKVESPLALPAICEDKNSQNQGAFSQ
jgi:hypothetical protein